MASNVSLQNLAQSAWPLTLGFGDGSAALWGGLGRWVGADARGRNKCCCFFAPIRLIIEGNSLSPVSVAQLNSKQHWNGVGGGGEKKSSGSFWKTTTTSLPPLWLFPTHHWASDDPPIWDHGEAMNGGNSRHTDAQRATR